MKINCEIPDDVGQIFKDCLLINWDDDQNVGQHMALCVANEAKHKLHEQWRKLDGEAHVDRGDGKKIARKEIRRRIDILENFCRGVAQQVFLRRLTVKRRKAKEKKI